MIMQVSSLLIFNCLADSTARVYNPLHAEDFNQLYKESTVFLADSDTIISCAASPVNSSFATSPTSSVTRRVASALPFNLPSEMLKSSSGDDQSPIPVERFAAERPSCHITSTDESKRTESTEVSCLLFQCSKCLDV
jgi:hypothetical protein